MSLEISVNPTAAVCERFCGSAMHSAQFHRQAYHRRNLIRGMIKPAAARMRFRCFARNRATCLWLNAVKWSKAKPTNDHSGGHGRDNGWSADRQRRGRSFGSRITNVGKFSDISATNSGEQIVDL